MEFEDIQQLRWKQSIEDLALHAAISGLEAGDSVNLTFRADKESFAGDTQVVRITRIKGCAFRGKLAAKPARIGLSDPRVGSLVRFRATHVHSIAKR